MLKRSCKPIAAGVLWARVPDDQGEGAPALTELVFLVGEIARRRNRL